MHIQLVHVFICATCTECTLNIMLRSFASSSIEMPARSREVNI